MFRTFHWLCCIPLFNFIGTVKVFLVCCKRTSKALQNYRRPMRPDCHGLSSAVTWTQPSWTFIGKLEDLENQVLCDKLCWEREPKPRPFPFSLMCFCSHSFFFLYPSLSVQWITWCVCKFKRLFFNLRKSQFVIKLMKYKMKTKNYKDYTAKSHWSHRLIERTPKPVT